MIVFLCLYVVLNCSSIQLTNYILMDFLIRCPSLALNYIGRCAFFGNYIASKVINAMSYAKIYCLIRCSQYISYSVPMTQLLFGLAL